MLSVRVKSPIALFVSILVTTAFAQTENRTSPLPSAPVPQQQHSRRVVSWKRLLPDVAQDQKQIWWVFPKELAHGKHWLPTSAVVAGTAGLIALDPHDDPYFRRTTAFRDFNRVMSFNGTIAASAVPATTYIVGVVGHNPYAQETAELTAEAVIDAAIPALVTKDIARRIPPSDIPPHGDFSDSWFRSHRGPFNLPRLLPGKILDERTVRLQCESCGQVWSPSLRSGRRLPRAWWRCPSGCNNE
jgi:hypothetical protein